MAWWSYREIEQIPYSVLHRDQKLADVELGRAALRLPRFLVGLLARCMCSDEVTSSTRPMPRWRSSSAVKTALPHPCKFSCRGVDAVPAATDFEVVPQPNHLLRWLPDAQALADSTLALKEYLGLWVYRWRGWAE